MSDKMTVQQVRDAVSYCHPRMPEMLANFEASVRADERAKADAVITATQKWIDAMDKWLETGVPSSPEASKAIYEQAIAAIKEAKETK